MVVALAAPSAGSLLTPSIDPASLLLVVLLGGGYALGVRARRRRGAAARWPPGRSVAFALGMVVLAGATQSGLSRYDGVLLSLHMVQHLLLGMVAPLLLALGAPITLALQALTRPWQVALLRLLNLPVAQAITHPVVAWSLFSLSLFGVYFTPLFELSLRNSWVHTAVHLHFLASGFLFCWSVLGVDVARRRTSHPVRLLAVLLTVPLHAILGLALQAGADRPLGASVYGAVERSWGPTLAEDQRTAASVLWGLGELWGVLLIIIVAARWMAADARRQQREDLRLDAALAAQASAGDR